MKRFLKRFIPASSAKADKYYKELKKENEELIKLVESMYDVVLKEVRDKKQRETIESIKRDVAETRKMAHENRLRLRRMEVLSELNNYGVTTEKRDRQIVVSFTTYQKRINTLPLVIDRILNQTIKPDRIVLYLAKDNFPKGESELPERLLNMKECGLEIRWCDRDIRPYKKIIPALKDFPEDIIITIDDDLYYGPDFIEKLYNSYRKHPDAISAYRAHRMRFDDEGNLLPYKEWDMECSDIIDEPSFELFSTNGAGTLFPPHIFNEEVFNEDKFMELCPSADDVWIKFMSVLSNVPVVVPEPFGFLYYVEGTQEESLWSANRTGNDVQIQNVLTEYNEYQQGKPPLIARIRG